MLIDLKKSLKKNELIIYILIFLSIISGYISIHVYPEIFLNNDTMELIRYFSPDEFHIMKAALSIYSHPLQFEMGPGYPMFFYYLVGVIFSPIMFFTGINVNLVGDAIKFATVFSFVLLSGVLLLSSKKIFSSWIPALIAIIFALSRGLFEFGLVMRPDFFEITMLFCTFGTLSLFLQTNKIKFFIYSVIFASLCFGIKFDGIFLIPILGFILYQTIIKGDIDNIKIIKMFSYINKITSYLMFSIIPVIGLSAYYIIFVIKRKSIGLSIYQSASSEYIMKLISFASFVAIIMFVGAIVILYLVKRLNIKKLNHIDLSNNFAKIYIAISSVIVICMSYLLIYILTNPFIIFHPIESSQFFLRFYPLFIGGAEKTPLSMNYSYHLSLIWFKILFEATGIYLGIGVLIISFIGMIKLFFFDAENKSVKDFFTILIVYVIIKYAFLVLFIQWQTANFLYSITFILFLISGYSLYYLIGKRPLIHLIIVLLSIGLLLPSIKVSNLDVYKYRSKDAVYVVSKWFIENIKNDNSILSNNFALPDGYEITFWEESYYSMDAKTNKPIYKNKLQFLQEKQSSYLILTDKDIEQLSTAIIDYIDKYYFIKKQFTNQAYPYSTHGDKYVYIYEKNN